MSAAYIKAGKPENGRLKLLIIVALSLGAFLSVTRQQDSGAQNSTTENVVRPTVRSTVHPTVHPSVHTQSDGAGDENIPKLPLERFKRERQRVKKTHVFIAKSWYVPPPPPPPVPAPAPSAPPLPFTFMGKMQEAGGKLTIYLSDRNRVHLVSGGEIIDDTYRVDGIENGKLALTYLPLQIKQYVVLGETP